MFALVNFCYSKNFIIILLIDVKHELKKIILINNSLLSIVNFSSSIVNC
jgi:hypothetical protein